MKEGNYDNFNAINEFLAPQNLVIDTKINVLGGIVIEIEGVFMSGLLQKWKQDGGRGNKIIPNFHNIQHS